MRRLLSGSVPVVWAFNLLMVPTEAASVRRTLSENATGNATINAQSLEEEATRLMESFIVLTVLIVPACVLSYWTYRKGRDGDCRTPRAKCCGGDSIYNTCFTACNCCVVLLLVGSISLLVSWLVTLSTLETSNDSVLSPSLPPAPQSPPLDDLGSGYDHTLSENATGNATINAQSLEEEATRLMESFIVLTVLIVPACVLSCWTYWKGRDGDCRTPRAECCGGDSSYNTCFTACNCCVVLLLLSSVSLLVAWLTTAEQAMAFDDASGGPASPSAPPPPDGSAATSEATYDIALAALVLAVLAVVGCLSLWAWTYVKSRTNLRDFIDKRINENQEQKTAQEERIKSVEANKGKSEARKAAANVGSTVSSATNEVGAETQKWFKTTKAEWKSPQDLPPAVPLVKAFKALQASPQDLAKAWPKLRPIAKKVLWTVLKAVRDNPDAQSTAASVYNEEKKRSLKSYTSIHVGIRKDLNFNEFEKYSTSLAEKLATQGRPALCKQGKADFADLLLQAEKMQDRFKRFMVNLEKRTSAAQSVGPLKGGWRAVEKMTFRPATLDQPESDDSLDSTVLCDVLRGALECPDFIIIKQVLETLVSFDEQMEELDPDQQLDEEWNKLRKEYGTIKLLRMKNRFIQASAGGWADILINFTFSDDDEQHVMELQVHHEKMVNVRKGGMGHKAYDRSRSAFELLESNGKLSLIKGDGPPPPVAKSLSTSKLGLGEGATAPAAAATAASIPAALTQAAPSIVQPLAPNALPRKNSCQLPSARPTSTARDDESVRV